jgi:hypothetical protein
LVKIFCCLYVAKIKKPKATQKNLKASAVKGSLLSIIGFVVTNADDHKTTKINGKTLIIIFIG